MTRSAPRKRKILFRAVARGGPPAALALALLAGPVVAAPGDDPGAGAFPDAGQVDRARTDVQAKAADAVRLQAELDRARAELDRSALDAARAVEAYNGAQVQAGLAARAAGQAKEQVAAAGTAVAQARDELGRLAAEAYRMDGGSRLGTLGMLLDSSTPSEAAMRAEAMRTVLRAREEGLRRSSEAARLAQTARHTAEAAARRTRETAETVRSAYAAAAAKVAEQQSRVGEFALRQDRLLADLAAARDTTLELERQRQEGLAEQARQRAEAEARRRAEEAARQTAAAAGRPQARPGAAGGASGGSAQAARPAPVRSGAAAAIAYAKAQLGKPYIWGGEGPHGYDCSGLVVQAWRQAGVALTHFAATQYAESRPVGYAELRPGDLIFWTETPRAEDIHHVAMYLGDGLMIHAPRTGDVIRISSMFYMGTPDFYARP
ncbi:C40 family peptidase [Yinghuangia soli]|uniref:NlpC/P60 family protein n=1 Tax=Yinghuangia soli TaxID=2908204 RepID=A0AA41U190_9ACTN|nr:C40 family peptidase [Yinghuangia soli]MCF2529305.1 NlpC/P60 family protein [Yinghuangia soli]